MFRRHVRRLLCAAAIASSTISASAACDLALAFAVDVSGSIDGPDYQTQMAGLAEALRDPVVANALADRRSRLLLVQWTGAGQQIVSLPWTQVRSVPDVHAVARRIEGLSRSWSRHPTALGEALMFTAAAFAQVPDCYRRVIDVSGDGVSNEGRVPGAVRDTLAGQGITVNALAIEHSGTGRLTRYFRRNVIAGPGAFVQTAIGFGQFSEAMREKLQREIAGDLVLAE